MELRKIKDVITWFMKECASSSFVGIVSRLIKGQLMQKISNRFDGRKLVTVIDYVNFNPKI
jgi:hypothetical protein